jgi:hypothetical protein
MKRKHLIPQTKGIIYALSDPRNPNLPKYVGKTQQTIQRRVSGHILAVKSRPSYELSKWIESLLDVGLLPRIYVLESVVDGDLRARETAWIRFFRPLGLLNQSDGDGMLGMKHPLPQEVRDRVAKLRTGTPLSLEAKRKWMAHPNTLRSQAGFGSRGRFPRRPIASKDGKWRFGSILEGAKAIGVDFSSLRAALISPGRKCRGTQWEYAEIVSGHQNPTTDDLPPKFTPKRIS